jgi:hypothetical protein
MKELDGLMRLGADSLADDSAGLLLRAEGDAQIELIAEIRQRGGKGTPEHQEAMERLAAIMSALFRDDGEGVH